MILIRYFVKLQKIQTQTRGSWRGRLMGWFMSYFELRNTIFLCHSEPAGEESLQCYCLDLLNLRDFSIAEAHFEMTKTTFCNSKKLYNLTKEEIGIVENSGGK